MKSGPEIVAYQTRGGLLSLAELRLLAEAATAQGDPRLFAVGRQEIALSGLGFAQAMRLLGQPGGHILQPWSPTRPANIMTTGPVAGLDGTNPWLSAGAFRDLLESFRFAPRRSIALTDPSQAYLPAFLGEINFLATDQRDQWRIRLALPEFGEESLLPGAIRSLDIPKAVAIIENYADAAAPGGDPSESTRALTEALEPIGLPAPAFSFPSVSRYRCPAGALVIPIPEEGIRSDFCLDLCVWAARLPGISVGLTPWRTFLVRGLSESATRELRGLLIRRCVAETCGPWRPHFLNSLSEDGAEWLCRAVEAQCPVDAGLSIGVVPADAPAPDLHVLVREGPRTSRWGRLRPTRYSVQRRSSYDARNAPWTLVAADIRRRDLGSVVLQAIDMLTGPPQLRANNEAMPMENVAPDSAGSALRCRSCLNEYDAIYGDPAGRIAPGTPFGLLSEDWGCPVCGGPKSDYEAAAVA